MGESIVTVLQGMFRKKDDTLKSIVDKLSYISEDKAYIRHFAELLCPEIYKQHLDNNFICCAFCNHLEKSSCHKYCFKCHKGTYDECGALLPGTFTFIGNHFEAMETKNTPWIFKTPCTAFERLNKKKYFKNFISKNQSITVANYEALEGIFAGLSRGKCPCHICASVNIDIYNNCSSADKNAENIYCHQIIEQISAKYQTIAGMIKYVE